ncbi:hypothetical protein G6011_00509 [Alternaria panax]|uniref:Uncharacterized protein n=1 Tax=Alternaria panax TaxID=48097 RepID=A0AAD4IJ67_9PLEO|nr:hypothetical protein G6011_00509 [Alternaria panax]
MQLSFKDQLTSDAAHALSISKPAPHRHHRTEGDDSSMPSSSRRGKPRAQFLLDIPAHEYKLPKGRPINATIVDLIVVVPQWFRNPGITWRFLNNGINAAVHVAILEQHRHLGLTSPEEAERARDHISDTYRKTMRKMENLAGWTKAGHNIPGDWDKLNISISQYRPEASKKVGYVRPPPIPFIDLAIGLKKLPQGHDAGDLSCALQFAVQNQKLDEHGQPAEFMFPDDIQLILNYTGRTQNTEDHVDGTVLSHYSDVLRATDGARRQQILEQRRQQQTADIAAAKSFDQSQTLKTPSYQESSGGYGIRPSPLEVTSLASSIQLHIQPAASFPTSSRGYDGMPVEGMGVLLPTTLNDSPMIQQLFRDVPQGVVYEQSETQGYGRTAISDASYSSPCILYPVRSNPQEAAASIASDFIAQGAPQVYADFPDIPDICKFETDDPKSPFVLDNWSHVDPQRATEDMDALMAAHQNYDLNGFPNPVPYSPQARYSYHPSTLLQDCPEGLDPNDHSDLARASRWARQYEYLGDESKLGNIDLVLMAMNISCAISEPGGH